MSQLTDICFFLPLSEKLATAGQPIEPQFASILAADYKVIVNLALSTSTNALPSEQEIVESLGMEYVHIPVVWEQPTLENLEQFFAVMQSNANRRVFVHCAKNMRVSVFMYLYRVLHAGVDEAAASSDMYRIWSPNETWQKFIEQAIQHYQN